MRRSFLVMFVCFLGLLLAGCMTYDLDEYGSMDANAKSIIVPSENSRILRLIKNAFYKDGWSVSVRDSVKIDDVKKQDTETYREGTPRYRLLIDSTPRELNVFTGTVTHTYDISIIDNKTKQEVFALHGYGKDYVIVEKILEATHRLSK